MTESSLTERLEKLAADMTLDVYGHLMPGAERDAIQAFDQLLYGANVCQKRAKPDTQQC